MPLKYPTTPHARKHGPEGYVDYQSYKPWLRDEFSYRCVYCLTRERWAPDGHWAFSVDHVIARHLAPQLVCDYENLVYACLGCNAARAHVVLPFDPCSTAAGAHLHVGDDGRVEALSTQGAKMVRLLRLNRTALVGFRYHMMRVVRFLVRQSDPEAAALLQRYLGFPGDLPDLPSLRPPAGNTRPAGVTRCHFALRGIGELPAVYW